MSFEYKNLGFLAKGASVRRFFAGETAEGRSRERSTSCRDRVPLAAS